MLVPASTSGLLTTPVLDPSLPLTPPHAQVSAFVKDLLPAALDGAEGLEESAAAALQMAFLEVDTKLHQGEVDCEFSGCTAVAAVLQGMKLHVAWAGDARALLGRVGQGNLLETLPLTKDHKPEVPAPEA